MLKFIYTWVFVIALALCVEGVKDLKVKLSDLPGHKLGPQEPSPQGKLVCLPIEAVNLSLWDRPIASTELSAIAVVPILATADYNVSRYPIDTLDPPSS